LAVWAAKEGIETGDLSTEEARKTLIYNEQVAKLMNSEVCVCVY
jgi:hypothetical protein